jgi:pteridine reductase
MKTAVVTGSAARLGLAIARMLHSKGYNVLIHYRKSQEEAEAACKELNAIRNNSAMSYQADLCDLKQLPGIIEAAIDQWGRLNVLVNNASDFYATHLETATVEEWHALIDSNLTNAYFLAQAARIHLKKSKGCIINMTDSDASLGRSVPEFAIYSIAKSGAIMMTKALATELGPEVRVNAIAPGITLWSEHQNLPQEIREKLINRTLLKRLVSIEDIALTAWFLVENTSMTGQVVNVDAGKFW